MQAKSATDLRTSAEASGSGYLVHLRRRVAFTAFHTSPIYAAPPLAAIRLHVFYVRRILLYTVRSPLLPHLLSVTAHLSAFFSDPAYRRHRRVAGHVLYWAAALAFFTLYFGRPEGGSYGQSLLFVSALLPITIATTYFLLYGLIPRYLLKRRYGLFALYFCYTLLLSLYLEVGLVVVLYMTVAEYQALVVKPGLADQLDVIVGMYLVVFLAAALHLLKSWYAMQTLNHRLRQARLEAELKLKEAELDLLRSQLHPHFLFNTLNSLYALTLERSDLAPEVVLRIADVIDYMLYRGDAERVPLDDEIEHLRNYVALERLRHDDRLQVEFDVEGPVARWTVAPLLLIPFVENSFKHGINAVGSGGWVQIALTVDETQLRFRVVNSNTAEPAVRQDGLSSGIGLENVRKRLAHLYPDRHTLHVTEEADRHTIVLTLDEAPSERADSLTDDADPAIPR